jgi:hypothetical protein
MDVMSIFSSLLGDNSGSAGGGNSAIDKKRQYFQYLMSMMNPSYQPVSMKSPGQSVKGSNDNLFNLVGMLGGNNNIGDRYSFGGAGNLNQSVRDNRNGNSYDFDLSSFNNY